MFYIICGIILIASGFFWSTMGDLTAIVATIILIVGLPLLACWGFKKLVTRLNQQQLKVFFWIAISISSIQVLTIGVLNPGAFGFCVDWVMDGQRSADFFQAAFQRIFVMWGVWILWYGSLPTLATYVWIKRQDEA